MLFYSITQRFIQQFSPGSLLDLVYNYASFVSSLSSFVSGLLWFGVLGTLACFLLPQSESTYDWSLFQDELCKEQMLLKVHHIGGWIRFPETVHELYAHLPQLIGIYWALIKKKNILLFLEKNENRGLKRLSEENLEVHVFIWKNFLKTWQIFISRLYIKLLGKFVRARPDSCVWMRTWLTCWRGRIIFFIAILHSILFYWCCDLCQSIFYPKL